MVGSELPTLEETLLRGSCMRWKTGANDPLSPLLPPRRGTLNHLGSETLRDGQDPTDEKMKLFQLPARPNVPH